jgi:cell division protein FtsL
LRYIKLKLLTFFKTHMVLTYCIILIAQGV